MRPLLASLALAAALPAQALAWTPPPGHCLLGAPETPMILQAAALVAPLELLPERISAPCAAIAAAHAEGRQMLTEVPLLVFGRPAILEGSSAQMDAEGIRRWTETFMPNAETSLADAWPEASDATIEGWRATMERGEGAALAQDLEARAATTPPTGAYAVVLSAGDEEMRFLVEDPQAGLRLGVRVHLAGGRMAWTVSVSPGLPDPRPLDETLALLEAEAAANR